MVQPTNWKKKYLKYKLKLEKIEGGSNLHDELHEVIPKSAYIFQKIINRSGPQLVFISSGCSMDYVQNCRGTLGKDQDYKWDSSPNSYGLDEYLSWRKAKQCYGIKDNYEHELRSLYGGLFVYKTDNKYYISEQSFNEVCGQQCPYPIMQLAKVMPQLPIEIILIDPDFDKNPVPSFLPPWFIPESRPGYTPENYFYENKVISYTFNNMRVSVIAEEDYRYNRKNSYEIFKDFNINNIGEIVEQNGGIFIDRGGAWNGIRNIWENQEVKPISDSYLWLWGIWGDDFLTHSKAKPQLLKYAEENFNYLNADHHQKVLKGTNNFLINKFKEHFKIDEL